MALLFYSGHYFLRRKTAALLIFFLMNSGYSFSQDNRIPDSLFESIIEPPDTAINPGSGHEYNDDGQENENIQDADTNYFLNKSKFSNEMTVLRHLPDSLNDRMKKDEAFWYADHVFVKEIQNTRTSKKIPVMEREWFQNLLWFIIIGAFSGFVLMYLSNSNILFFRKKPRSISENTAPKDLTENIFSINYSKEIDKAVRENDYRLAVRLMFLRLLKQLSEKKIIQYMPDKTNFDYLRQLSSTGYYPDFFNITRNYEYAWYGKFEISVERFAVIKNEFEKMEQRIK